MRWHGILYILQFSFWCLAYLFALLRGWRDKTYSIPLPAILLNVAWELLACTVYRQYLPVAPVMAITWLLLDLCILFQVFLYSPNEFPGINRFVFASLILNGLLLCIYVFHLAHAAGLTYLLSAFPQNLLMSILFVRMLKVRRSLRGQSFYIAIFKFLGTLCAMLFVLLNFLSPLYETTFAAIIFFDLIYLNLVWSHLQRAGANPWLLW
jgi:hypothetical protein